MQNLSSVKLVLSGLIFMAPFAVAMEEGKEKSVKISFGFELSENSSLYRAVPNAPDRFVQVSHLIKQENYIAFSGGGETPITWTQSEENVVPGQGCEGHSFLTLTLNDKSPSRILIDLLRKENSTESKINYSAQLMFLEGSVEAFLRGQTNKLQIPEQDMKDVSQIYLSMAENLFDTLEAKILVQLKEYLAEENDVHVTIDSFLTEGAVQLIGTKEEINLYSPKISCKASIEIK